MEPTNTPEIIADQAAPVVDTPATPEPATDPVPLPEKKFTKRERLEFAKNKIEQQIEELDAEEDDNRAVTVGDLKRMKREEAKVTALEMAEAIEDELERQEVMDLLENRIVPSGNPEKDIELARTAVNAERTKRALEEQARKGTPAEHAARPGAPGKTEAAFVPTEQELVFMRPPYNLSQEDIIKARRK